MDFLSAMKISASGLSAERTRVNLATSNLANAESTRGPDGELYRRLDPVLAAESFDQTLSASPQPQGVNVVEVVQDTGPGRRVYSPGHPDADGDGFVTFPNVNPIHEVVNLMSASKAYEANATSVETLKSMATRALDIAR
ncbi:MAG: flagellar basal body rod protein FlgC [Myxococcaceae bacterium]|nr:flagellar basal body rod protein FlgC [Myxococcaceae bacterium]